MGQQPLLVILGLQPIISYTGSAAHYWVCSSLLVILGLQTIIGYTGPAALLLDILGL